MIEISRLLWKHSGLSHLKLLGHHKAALPSGSRKAETSKRMAQGEKKRISVLTAGIIGNQQGALGTFNDYKGAPKSSDMVKV